MVIVAHGDLGTRIVADGDLGSRIGARGFGHGATSSRAPPAPHLKLEDELPLLEGAPVDGHPLVGDTLHVPGPDNVT